MMLKKILRVAFIFGICCLNTTAQNQYFQYFDGVDTLANSSIHIVVAPTPNNIWQIGKPHKSIFNSAATTPNAIVTDTLRPYAKNNISTFSFEIGAASFGNIFALRWKQKLDMEKHKDGGIIEFSLDNGNTWQNCFTSPIAHQFYGFELENKDTLVSGETVLSGTDTTWRDVWFCFYSFSSLKSIQYRFTFKSDDKNSKEGWMIDNFMAYRTMMHIVKENEKSYYLNVYPTATEGTVNIEAKEIQPNHKIEKIELFGTDGRLIQNFIPSSSKLSINISHLPNGIYYLKVDTNLQHEVFPLLLTR